VSDSSARTDDQPRGTRAAYGSLPSDQDASGRSFDAAELRALADALDTGALTSTRGHWVRSLEQRFADLVGAEHAIATSSGTSAIHAAIVAIDPEPGDEIVTTPITDMGAITPILYQGAIPVFADVDPHTGNVTAETIERCLSERTRAIVVTHLFGNPAGMSPILELARRASVPVIEDGAQAYLATSDGRYVGTIGTIGCFSLQQGKHITTGEGGLVVTDDTAIARRLRLFVNKAWPYGEPDPDHEFLALNARMSELQGAVGARQLEKLGPGVNARVRAAHALSAQLEGMPGIETPRTTPGATHTFWRYCLHVDPAIVPGGPVAVARELSELGIPSAPRYIQKPAFRCAVIAEQRTFGTSRFPFTLARPEALDYSEDRFPGAFRMLDTALVLPWNEHYGETHVDRLAAHLSEATRRTAPVAS
jgi:dTDP-4-amino-4,6-dideoxygalactose transaminase